MGEAPKGSSMEALGLSRLFEAENIFIISVEKLNQWPEPLISIVVKLEDELILSELDNDYQ